MSKDSIKPLSNVVIHSSPSATVGIADKVKELQSRGENVLNFSAGRAFESTPQYIIEEAYRALLSGDTHQTMARGTKAFRNGVAEKLKRENEIEADPEREIIATNGVKQGLTISLLCLLNPGDEVIIEDPCFVSYKQLIRYFGGVPIELPIRKENRYRWDPEELANTVTSKTKAILFNSPHNPTGTVHSAEDLKVIADVAIRHNLYVIVDEVYERTTWSGNEHICIATLPGMKERTISINSLTKSFSMGGWRIGYIHADQTLINQMEKLQQHLITSCNSFVQAGAALAFGEEPREEILEYWKDWGEKCAFFTAEINKIDGLSCYMPEGGFYAWVDITDLKISSEVFTSRLLEQEKMAVIPGASFGSMGEGYIRITCVRPWEEIREGLERLSRFVKSLQA